jgi:hypothetical protein
MHQPVVILRINTTTTTATTTSKSRILEGSLQLSVFGLNTEYDI